MHDSESGITKEIRPRLRSGATNQRANNQSEQATPNSLADKHAKRLKVAKSSRVTLGANDGGKPPRIGAGKNMEPEIDLTLSNQRNLPTELNKQAFLPQSLKAGSGEAEAPTESETYDSKQPYQ